MLGIEQGVLLLDKEEKLPFVSVIDLDGEDADLSTNFRNIYDAEVPIGGTGKVDDTEQVKKIRKIYRMDGTLIEEAADLEDDDEKDRRKKAISKPAYSRPDDPSQTMRQAEKQGRADYQPRAAETMAAPASALNRQAYVCLPGSKSACGTCPVYSLMSRPGVADRFNELRAGRQLSKASYLSQRSGLLR
ncbi:MAG: hypothetical protein HY516_02710 [Candidatus Aenigmarchaeota archaeon]|nr:hypothetical protein [Candidatus Aenigmarchaeota archaeon]